MSLRQQHVVLSLFQSRLAGAVVSAGRILRSEQIQLDPEQWETTWSEGLARVDQPLRQLMARLGVRGRPRVRVLFQSPSSQVQTFELTGRKADACAAARTRMRESVPAGHLTSAGAASRTLGKPGSWTVLGVSDREDHANAIFAWVYRCGGTLTSCLPGQAAVAHAAINAALAADDASAYCVIGCNWSAIVSGCSEGLNLVRTFEPGYQALTDVFARAMSVDSDRPIEEAEHALFTIGIPFKSRDVDPNLRARVLPLVSPVMQRFCVEIKQTMRFGLAPGTAPTSLVILGPGASIPHIGPVVSEGVDMHVRVESAGDGLGVLAPFAAGSIEHAYALHLDDAIALVPRSTAEQAASDRGRRAMIAGLAAAACLIAGEFAYNKLRIHKMSPEFDRLSPIVASMARERDQRAEGCDLAAAAGWAALAIREHAGPSLPWSRLLAALPGLVTDSIRIESIDGRADPARAVVEIAGYSAAASDADATAALTAFVHSIAQLDFVADAHLTSTQLESRRDAATVKRFTVAVQIWDAASEINQLARHGEMVRAEQGDGP